MSSVCPKCGHEVDGSSPICMYCGAALSETQIAPETKERLEKEKNEPSVSQAGSTTDLKALGAFLVILGILADVVSMFMIESGGFGTITIGGTICFLIGIAIVANS